MSTPIQRPNGKTYRPRKPPSIEIVTDLQDDTAAAFVLRTHDMHDAINRITDQLIFEHHLDPTSAHTDWVRLAPWGDDGGTWITDPVRGTPCVVIPAVQP
ncbi:MAG TPA: hypothetical protein VGL05_19340 [Kribbella sp.]